MLPTTINGYTLKHLLGEGGMANVYYAENRIGKCAAVKLLKPEFLAQAAIKQRFWQDAEIMAGLKHANIREVYDFVETDTYMAIIMEYLEGQDLNEYLKQQGAIAEPLVNTWFAALLDAFQYAHDKGIVHRDVKPSNVFLTQQGEVKIIDFGIAKINDGNHEWTLTHMKMGTPAYMSPEQILTPRNVDSRSDVYSLGVLYYTLLAGKKPYNEATASDYLIQEAVVKHSLPILGMASSNANALIAKATQKQVGNRYQTCREMLRTLQNSSIGASQNHAPQYTTPDEVTVIENSQFSNRSGSPKHSSPPPLSQNLTSESFYVAPESVTPKPQIATPPPLPIRAKPKPKPTAQHYATPTPISNSRSYTWVWVLAIVFIASIFMYNIMSNNTPALESGNAVANTQGVLTVNADKMNVRSTPEVDNENIIFQLPSGYAVRFMDTKKDARGTDWYQIEYGANSGWVSSKYAIIQSADALVNLPETSRTAERTINAYHQAVNNKDIPTILDMWSDAPLRYHDMKNPTKDAILNAINVSRCFGTSSEQAVDFVIIKDTNLGITSCYYTLNFMCNPNGSTFNDTKLRTIRTRTDINSNGKIVYSATTKISN